MAGLIDGRSFFDGEVFDLDMDVQLRYLYQWLGKTLDYKSCQEAIFCKVSQFRDVGGRRTASDKVGGV